MTGFAEKRISVYANLAQKKVNNAGSGEAGSQADDNKNNYNLSKKPALQQSKVVTPIIKKVTIHGSSTPVPKKEKAALQDDEA